MPDQYACGVPATDLLLTFRALLAMLTEPLVCRSPLFAGIAQNGVNLSLDLLLVFGAGWGVVGVSAGDQGWTAACGCTCHTGLHAVATGLPERSVSLCNLELPLILVTGAI